MSDARVEVTRNAAGEQVIAATVPISKRAAALVEQHPGLLERLVWDKLTAKAAALLADWR